PVEEFAGIPSCCDGFPRLEAYVSVERGSVETERRHKRQAFKDELMATRQPSTKTIEIKLAHSPDSDDAFMFYALATNRVKAQGLKFTHVLSDIETLNQAADRETYDVTAMSFAAYPYLKDKYVLLDSGASFGDGYGPMVVAVKPLKPKELAGKR